MEMWFIFRRCCRKDGPYPPDAETVASCNVEPFGRGKDPALRVSPRIFLPFQAPFLPDL
jgi:hypothetical protein